MKKIFLNIVVLFSLLGCVVASSSSLKGEEFTLKDTDYTLIFDKIESKFYGKAVNNYFGEYTLTGDSIKLNLQGSTMMMAPNDEMEKETEYFNNLNQITTYSINGSNLILKGKNIELIFNKQ